MSEIQPLQKLVLNPAINSRRITTLAELELLDDFFAKVKEQPIPALGLDVETPPERDFYRRQIRTIQFGDFDEQYVIDLHAFAGDKIQDCQRNFGANVNICPELYPVLEKISQVLKSKHFLKVGVNLAFEFECLYWNFGIRPWHLYSCDLAERVIWAGAHSLKDYPYYSLAGMIGRYFGYEVDKELQTSFTLTQPLSDAQIEYAALDTRLPLSLRIAQRKNRNLIIRSGWTGLGGGLVEDGLELITQIENDAIGQFASMHVHGQNINIEKWKKRIDGYVDELQNKTIPELDKHFIPVVGDTTPPSDIAIKEANEAWRPFASKRASLRPPSWKKIDEAAKQAHPAYAPIQALEAKIKELKSQESQLKKNRTKINKLIKKCEGKALINYQSKLEVKRVLQEHFHMKALETMEDEELAKFDVAARPYIKTLRRYGFLKKQISTYGYSWITKWNRVEHTGPNTDAWLHPDDGKLHPRFNQLDAATGRSTSDQPNGQNLPHDPEVRACFEADPNIRISKCCSFDCGHIQDNDTGLNSHICLKCFKPCDTDAEEYVLVTADMSGAELRIIAELADAKTWIEAFERGEDVHSVGTELLYPHVWPKVGVTSVLHPEGWTLEDCKTERIPQFNDDGTPLMIEKKGKLIHVHSPPCAYYALKSNGHIARQKCDCPKHKPLRDGNKATNFLLAYGGTAYTLKDRLGCSFDIAKELMAKHAAQFPDIWMYLEQSGYDALNKGASWDMFNRRRLFPKPDHDRAIHLIKSDYEEEIRLQGVDPLIHNFVVQNGRLPVGVLSHADDEGNLVYDFKNEYLKDEYSELWPLTHLKDEQIDGRLIQRAFIQLQKRITRQGKNHEIQGTNATIIKLALGSGSDKNGKRFLFHILPLYGATVLAMIHDELVVQCPKKFANEVAFEIGDAFKRAAAEKMSKVIMEFDYKIEKYWCK